jgi:hypothetical protein
MAGGQTAGQGDPGGVEIELAAAVVALRDELIEAASRGVGQDIELVVGSIELEFTVELRRDVQAKAGFKAWVVSADAGVGASRARTQRVTVTVTPRRPGGGDLVVSDTADHRAGPGDLSGHVGR